MSFGFKRLDNFKPIKIDDKLVEEVKENADTPQEIDESAIEETIDINVDISKGFEEKEFGYVGIYEGIPVTENTVLCLDTFELYDDYKVASEKTNVSANGIKKCCEGKQKTAGKMKWCYAKDCLNK